MLRTPGYKKHLLLRKIDIGRSSPGNLQLLDGERCIAVVLPAESCSDL